MKKLDLLNGLIEKNQQWQALLEAIGLERMEQPGVNGDWSMKDMIAHLNGWNRRLANELQAAQRGEPQPPPPWPAHLQAESEINDWIYASNRARTAQAVLDEAREINQQIMDIMKTLPDDARVELVEPDNYLVWIGNQRYPPGEFYDHFSDEHEQDVRAWLARTEEQ